MRKLIIISRTRIFFVRVAEWGFSFRGDYVRINSVRWGRGEVLDGLEPLYVHSANPVRYGYWTWYGVGIEWGERNGGLESAGVPHQWADVSGSAGHWWIGWPLQHVCMTGIVLNCCSDRSSSC